MSYLADTSAVWRFLRQQVDPTWLERLGHGLISICPPVKAELMRSVRSERDHEPFFAMLERTFGWLPTRDDPWRRVLAVQRDLIAIGHHRGPSPMDILIALTAEEHRVTLVHMDDDFNAVAKVRPGIAMARLETI